jgi:hypothetical protein
MNKSKLGGNGIGDYRPVDRIRSVSGKFVSKLYVSQLLTCYSPQHHSLNLFCIDEIDNDRARIWGHFVDPKSPRDRRLTEAQIMLEGNSGVILHTSARGKLLKREITKMCARYARKHGYFTDTVRTVTTLRRRAYQEYLAILPSTVQGKSVRKLDKISV